MIPRILHWKTTNPNLTGRVSFSKADTCHALQFGTYNIKHSTNYLIERVGVFCLYGLETKTMVKIVKEASREQNYPGCRASSAKCYCFACLCTMSSLCFLSKACFSFPSPEGRHLFGNFQEENAGTSSRSVVWKQKLSLSNRIVRRSQMPVRNLFRFDLFLCQGFFMTGPVNEDLSLGPVHSREHPVRTVFLEGK